MKREFTLIELLVVIAILAVLAVVVVLTLNPAGLLQESRDTNRLQDMATLSAAVGYTIAENPSASLGSSSVVYVSIPDTSSICANLGLPALPSGWNYSCAPASTYRQTNGSGWVPINFSSASMGSSMAVLPIDPTNNTSSALYYSYVTNGTQWEFTAFPESQKQKANLRSSPEISGYPRVMGQGSNFALSPVIDYNSGLVGYWTFDEGSGTTVYDSSGNGNNGTLSSPAPTWTAGKIGGALNFNGSTNYVNIPNGNYLNTNQFTISMWLNLATINTTFGLGGIISKYNYNTNGLGIAVGTGGSTANVNYAAMRGGTSGTPAGTLAWNLTAVFNTWNLYSFVVNYDGTNTYVTDYLNGTKIGSSTLGVGTFVPNSTALGIGNGFAGQSGYTNGLIDDVRLYNRALSGAEIAALYNSQN